MISVSTDTILKLHEDELKAFQFLEKEKGLQQDYLDMLPKARRSLLSRLAASLLREDVLELYSKSIRYKMGEIFPIDEQKNLLEILQSISWKEGQIFQVYEWDSKEYLVFPIQREFAFRRVEVNPAIYHICGHEVTQINDSVELLNLLSTRDSNLDWDQLIKELRNGNANLALAYVFYQQKAAEIRHTAKRIEAEDFLEYVLKMQKTDTQYSSSLYFEQLCTEGHNLHPGTKTKLGMEPDAVWNYSPECKGELELSFVAIHQDAASWSTGQNNSSNPNDILFESYPNLKEWMDRLFAHKGLNPQKFVVVPVHPWQMEMAIPTIYQKEITEGIVVPIERFSVKCYATSSFRTVVPQGEGKNRKLAFKVAVNSQMTSTIRSISPQTAMNAAKFTSLIREVMNRESELSPFFVPVCEVAGLYFKSSDPLKSRNLTTVFREDVQSFVQENQLAIVASTLYSESPITGKTILEELVRTYAKKVKEPNLSQAAASFFEEYATLLLKGVLTLMVKYGIGIEGHMQNCIPVFQDGRPIRILFRDWGGARILKQRLEAEGIVPEFEIGSVTLTEQLSEMQNKVFYTVFQNHIGEIIEQICKAFGNAEKSLWKSVHSICDHLFEILLIDPDYEEAVVCDRDALYKREVEHKALTKMRLIRDSKGYCYSTVPNPLYEVIKDAKDIS